MQNKTQNPNALYLATKDPNGAMIDLVSSTNQRFSVPKHLILENRFFPGDRISVRFGSLTLSISGKNLLPIYKAIGSQKIVAMREGCPDRESEDNFATWIDSIEICKTTRTGEEVTIFPE